MADNNLHIKTGMVVDGDISASNVYATASWAAQSSMVEYVDIQNLPSLVSSSQQLVVGGGLAFSVQDDLIIGEITASAINVETLVLTTLSSSVVYSSGSNIFGNNETNVHEFTGSVRVSGSIEGTASWASEAVQATRCYQKDFRVEKTSGGSNLFVGGNDGNGMVYVGSYTGGTNSPVAVNNTRGFTTLRSGNRGLKFTDDGYIDGNTSYNTGISSPSASLIEINDGTTLGQYRDLMLRNLFVSGSVTANGGTKEVPTYSFTEDTGSGVYLDGVNSVGISAGGLRVAYFKNNGINFALGCNFFGNATNFKDDNINLNFFNSAATVQGGVIHYEPTGNGLLSIGAFASTKLALKQNGADRLVITGSAVSVSGSLQITDGKLTVDGGGNGKKFSLYKLQDWNRTILDCSGYGYGGGNTGFEVNAGQDHPASAFEIYVHETYPTAGARIGLSNRLGTVPSASSQVWKNDGIIEQRHLGITQNYRIYKSYTNASNFERMSLGYISGSYQVWSEASGSGTRHDLVLDAPNVTILGSLSATGSIEYTPISSSHWNTPPPTTIAEALDRIAAALSASGSLA